VLSIPNECGGRPASAGALDKLTISLEYPMFAYLFQKFCDLLECAEHSHRDAYLASSIDIFELERRMRQSEVSDLPVTQTNN
jgi:hypothetical protein